MKRSKAWLAFIMKRGLGRRYALAGLLLGGAAIAVALAVRHYFPSVSIAGFTGARIEKLHVAWVLAAIVAGMTAAGLVAMRMLVDRGSRWQSARLDPVLAATLDDIEHAVLVCDARTLEPLHTNPTARELPAGEDTGSVWPAGLTRGLFAGHVAQLDGRHVTNATGLIAFDDRALDIKTRRHAAAGGDVFVSVMRDAGGSTGMIMQGAQACQDDLAVAKENAVPEDEPEENPAVDLGSLAVISHEMRTPLTSIKGSLRLLESGATGELSPKAQQVVDIAARNTVRVLSMVNGILDYERLRGADIECPKTELSLRDLLLEIVAETEGYGHAHEVGIDVGHIPLEAVVTGNTDLLNTAVSNLISNAIKHTDKGKSVRVRVRDRGEAWRIRVEDQGPGLPHETRTKVFDSFARPMPADGIARAGTGLGLAIAQRAVALHDGQISFRSRLGQGTVFFLDLPKSDDARVLEPEVALDATG